MGYLMRHHLRTEGASGSSQRIITQFVKVRQEGTSLYVTFFPIYKNVSPIEHEYGHYL